MNARLLIGSAIAAAGVLTAAAIPATAHSNKDTMSGQLAGLRAATDNYHSIAVAEQHGYALLTDAHGIACIDMPGMGGMGVH
jgi:hypothetical protein